MRAERAKAVETVLFVLLLIIGITSGVRSVSAYTPKAGDSFDYSETITVNNGQGSYLGYTDQTLVKGMEQMNSVTAGLVSSSFSSSYQYSSSQGNSSSYSSSGKYTWSSGNFTYATGTDNQVGYSRPTYVWFAMTPSLSIGASFYALNTHMTILSKNYSLQLPTEGKAVQTIQAQGTGEYQRDDSYGVFTATYTWTEYFDTATGYIVGYNYVEQDSGEYQGLAGSFTYTDDLYVASTSYALASATPTTTTTSSPSSLGSTPLLTYALAIAAVLVIIAVVVYAATRRRGKGQTLPKHPEYTPPPPPPPPSPSPPPAESRIDLGSRPGEQVVIREVAKVNCKFCGTLIPTTAEACPYCGAPRQ